MNWVAFVLISFVVLAAGLDNTPSTGDAESDITIIQNFLLSCPALVPLFTNCLDQNNYNNNPGGNSEECESQRIAYGCWNSSFVVTTCPDKQKAIDALGRLEPVYLPACYALGNVSSSIVARFLTVIIMTCVSLLY